MNNIFKQKEKLVQNGVFALLMAATAVFLVWKCRFGFANMDESLYLAIPYRLWQGDGMFVNEWNLSSFSSILMLPLMWLYMAVVGTTEGILLNFRYIFVAVQGLVAVFLYFKLKRYNWIGALTAALSFFIYAPFSIMALSYNSMGIQCVTVAMVLILTNDNAKKLPYILAGVLFAGAVLCCPYLAAVYALYTAVVFVGILCKKSFALDILDKNCWLWTTAGVVLLAAAFLAFSLSRASVSDMIVALQWMLNDPQHQSVALITVVKKYIIGILESSSISLYIFVAFAVLGVVALFAKDSIKPAIFCCGAVLTGLMMLPFVTTKLYINYTMFPVNILALLCLLLTKNKTARRLFWLLWVPGALYSVCIHFASNQGFYNISSVFTVSLMGSLLIVCITTKELVENSNIKPIRFVTICALAAVLLMQVMCVSYTRHQQVFWEKGRHTQTELITQGPEKGILASEQRTEPYNQFMEDAQQLWQQLPESVLYLSQDTWMYLATQDSRMATFSPWLPGADEGEMKNSMERLYGYFEINADKMPQTVYALAVHHQFAEEFAAKYGYTETITPNGNYVYTK